MNWEPRHGLRYHPEASGPLNCCDGFIREWVCQPRPARVQVLFDSGYNAPLTAAGASQFDHDQMHGGWVENIRWTSGAGAGLPAAGVRALLESGWAR